LRFLVTKRFERAYRALPSELQFKADKTLRLLADNPRHSSLHLNKIGSTPGVWEARVDGNCRMTLDIRGDAILLRNVGKHDETLGSP
jgi:hypothetical protein